MQEDEKLNEIILKPLLEKVDKMNPKNMKNVESVEDYLNALDESENMGWEALSILFIGSANYMRKSFNILKRIDESMSLKFAEEICKEINNDPLLVVWHKLLANYRDFAQEMPFTKNENAIHSRISRKKKNK